MLPPFTYVPMDVWIEDPYRGNRVARIRVATDEPGLPCGAPPGFGWEAC